MYKPRTDCVAQDAGHDSGAYSGGLVKHPQYEPIYTYKNDQADINRRFAEYLEGKTVAIVGRANLHQLEQGEFIDSHDVVVRLRSTQPYMPDIGHKVTIHSVVPADYRRLVGSRTDVFYHAIPDENKEGRLKKDAKIAVEQFYENGGKFLCNADCQFVPLRYTLIDQFTPVRYVNDIFKIRLRQKLNARNLVDGVIVIADILSHNIKSAYITGFPCYFDGMYKGQEEAPRWHDWSGNCIALRFIHDMTLNERVSADPLMMELFETHCK